MQLALSVTWSCCQVRQLLYPVCSDLAGYNDIACLQLILTTASPSLAPELSEDGDDDAGSIKTVNLAALNHTLVPLMKKVSVDGKYDIVTVMTVTYCVSYNSYRT